MEPKYVVLSRQIVPAFVSESILRKIYHFLTTQKFRESGQEGKSDATQEEREIQ